MIWRGMKRWHRVWRWFIYAVISFLLSISIFVNFSLAIDPPLEIGEIRQIPVTEKMGAYNEKYQAEVTGVEKGQGYGAGVPKETPRSTGMVKFDGKVETPNSIKLQDAKGFGYPVNNDGSWQTGNKGNRVANKEANQLIRQIKAAKAAETRSGKPVTVEWSLAEEKYKKAFNEEVPKRASRILEGKPDSTISQKDLERFNAKYVEPSEDAKNTWKEHQKGLRENRKKKSSSPSGSSY
jgi:hypothetical protein